jgi:hypothetical protein
LFFHEFSQPLSHLCVLTSFMVGLEPLSYSNIVLIVSRNIGLIFFSMALGYLGGSFWSKINRGGSVFLCSWYSPQFVIRALLWSKRENPLSIIINFICLYESPEYFPEYWLPQVLIDIIEFCSANSILEIHKKLVEYFYRSVFRDLKCFDLIELNAGPWFDIFSIKY